MNEVTAYLRDIGITSGAPRPTSVTPPHPHPSPAGGEGRKPKPADQLGGDLETLRAEIGDCTRCKLAEGRTKLVFGSGNPKASLMFVGEGPGYEEDQQGLPFVGKAGELLTRMIIAMGFKRDEVYIANVVKCRPPNNRTPEADEIATCKPFLQRQIELIGPKVIVSLGGVATQALLHTEEKISRLRGAFRSYAGIPLMPTYHPAFLLRNPEMKKPVWEDLQKVMAKLREK